MLQRVFIFNEGMDAHRRSWANPASVQRMLPATGHFSEGKEVEVTNLVKDWLDKTL